MKKYSCILILASCLIASASLTATPTSSPPGELPAEPFIVNQKPIAMDPVYIVDEIKTVVAKTDAAFDDRNVFYMYGHPLEIVNNLQELTNTPKMGDKKYPLIALFTDIPIERSKRPGLYGTATLQMIIATWTEANYSAAQRQEKNFVPVLYPIYQEFLKQLKKHRQFTFENNEVPHTQIDRFYWGKQGLYGSVANQFNDFIDCIELKNLIVPIKNQICSPTSNF